MEPETNRLPGARQLQVLEPLPGPYRWPGAHPARGSGAPTPATPGHPAQARPLRWPPQRDDLWVAVFPVSPCVYRRQRSPGGEVGRRDARYAPRAEWGATRCRSADTYEVRQAVRLPVQKPRPLVAFPVPRQVHQQLRREARPWQPGEPGQIAPARDLSEVGAAPRCAAVRLNAPVYRGVPSPADLEGVPPWALPRCPALAP